MKHFINRKMIEEFRQYLEEEERSRATVEKYVRDVKMFFLFMGENGEVDKTEVIAYKEYLITRYAAASVNSMLAAVNVFLKERGWNECTVKALKIQKEAFRSDAKELTREEYYSLLKAAKKNGNLRLYLIMQTLCSTGIRISELKYITAEAVRNGCARVCSKGKQRTVLLPVGLCENLKRYAGKCRIKRGSIFITRNGNPVDRSNVCHDMKALCRETGILREKVFPHNLRHLFAVTYYKACKDLSHLADLLGHSSINTTRIYTLVSSQEQAEQIEVLGFVV